MEVRGIRHGSEGSDMEVRGQAWKWEELDMEVGGVRHGSGRSQTWK